MWVMVCSTLWEWSTYLIISMKEFSFQLHISGDLVSVYKSLGYHHAVSDVQFHPLDHIIAFCSFGDSHPVLVYHYDPKGLFQRNMLYRVHTWLHLLVGTWKMMSQFSELYFTERPAKFKILFELKSSSSIWTQRHSIYLTNLVSRSLNTSGKNSVCNLQYGPRTRLIRGMVMMIVIVTMIMHMITKMLVGGIWVLEVYSPLHCLFLSPAAKEEAKKFMTSPVTSSKQAATSQQSTATPDDVNRHAQMADVTKDLLRMRKVKQKLDSVLVGVDYFSFEKGLTLISLSTYRVFNCVRENDWMRDIE